MPKKIDLFCRRCINGSAYGVKAEYFAKRMEDGLYEPVCPVHKESWNYMPGSKFAIFRVGAKVE